MKVCPFHGEYDTSRCLPCHSDFMRTANATDTRYIENNRRAALRRYNLTLEQFQELLDKQGGCCAICGATTATKKGNRAFYIDHDHTCCDQPNRSCGECIRGLLCHWCNCKIGWLERFQPQIESFLIGAR